MIFLFLVVPVCSQAQLVIRTPEEIERLQRASARVTVVFVHTPWCNYCQAMKATTFKDKAVVKKLNADFYFIDFDATFKHALRFYNKE